MERLLAAIRTQSVLLQEQLPDKSGPYAKDIGFVSRASRNQIVGRAMPDMAGVAHPAGAIESEKTGNIHNHLTY